MPALTHGRVKNGFNLFPRTIKYAQPNCNKEQTPQQKAAQEEREKQGYKKLAEYDPNGNRVCENAQRGLCCGSAIQPRNLGPGHLFQRYRVPTKPCNRKHASNVVTGRSFAAKRAIARRSANCNTSHHRTGLGTITFTVNADPEVLSRIGENPYLLDLYTTAEYAVPIGTRCCTVSILVISLDGTATYSGRHRHVYRQRNDANNAMGITTCTMTVIDSKASVIGPPYMVT